MASGAILAELADRKTLNLTKEDTAAIIKTLGSFSGGGTEDTVVKILQELLTQPKVIKHIQRGVGKGGTVNVQLAGFTNVDKMIVIINGDITENSRWTVCEYYLKSLTVSQAIIANLNNTNISESSCSYQVIEFC